MNQSERSFECLIFDLDGTLYDSGNGYVQNNRRQIFELMIEKGFATSEEEAESIWKPLFKEHNQSYKALRVGGGFDLDKDEFWSRHRAGVEKYLSDDSGKLADMLKAMPLKKYIFTNAREKEASQALQVLGVHDCFEHVYGADFLGDICKPQEDAFTNVLDDIGVRAANCVFFEDSVKNLVTGKALGMSTVLVQGFTSQEEGSIDESMFDVIVSTLTDGGEELRSAYPSLFAY